ncbi:MAG: N-formylglutamate amidohydrolase [Planctomycetales bacterium]
MMATDAWSPISFYGIDGTAPVVLICEHASAHFPRDFGSLGIDAKAQHSHSAWDIGALNVATGLSEILKAPLVAGGVSRLLYDCNRPFDSRDSIPLKSEGLRIAGNENLDDAGRNARYRLIHQPFHFAAEELIRTQSAKAGREAAVVTVHSFTSTYFGNYRDVEIGFLHHENTKLSEIAHQIECRRGSYRAELNEPYDASDGVTYSMGLHADKNARHSTMIEIRNDLIDTDRKSRAMAKHLAETIRLALERIAAQEGSAG